jgi:hypothetical protein
MRDIETIDSELRLVAARRRAAGERGGPLPSIDVAAPKLDVRLTLAPTLNWATGTTRASGARLLTHPRCGGSPENQSWQAQLSFVTPQHQDLR